MARRFLGIVCLLLLGVGGLTTAVSAQAPSLLITELFYNPPGPDAAEEWIEIANLGETAVLLADYKIGDEAEAGGGEGMTRFPEGATLAPGQAIVIAQTATGFRARFGEWPDYELGETETAVPTMRPFPLWASGEIALANDGDEVLLLDGENAIVDALSYGESTAVFTPSIPPAIAGQSLQRRPAACDSDSAADWGAYAPPTPGAVALGGNCAAPAPPPSQALLPIGAIQGDGPVSPYRNQTVTFRGVVTGVQADQNQAGTIFHTIFVQDLPGEEDGDPATSDGVAVFLGRERPAVRIGEQVRVTGQVTEFFGLTEIEDDGLELVVESDGAPLPSPIPIDPPAANDAVAAYLEPLEGMQVTTPDTARVVNPTFAGCGFAVMGDEVAPRPLRRRESDPVGQIVPVLSHTDVSCPDLPPLKAGDLVSGLTGPLTYHFDQYKIVLPPEAELDVEEAPLPPLPAPPPVAAGQLSVASVNLENYFDAVDDTGSDAEPKPSPAQIAVRRQKLAYAIGRTLACPTLVGVQEVENEALLLDLAEETAVYCPFTYAVTHRESPDARGIDVALLSDPRRVAVNAAALEQTCSPLATDISDPAIDCAGLEDPLFSRPPLRVETVVDGEAVTVWVNHFKSKRGGAAETAPRRLAQAEHINALAAERLAGDPDAKLIVLGDFNDYENAPPLQRMTVPEGLLVNALAQVPLAERYTFVFAGAGQLLDGILLSPALAEALTAVSILHVNADYPAAWGEDVSPERLPYRATDHDLPLVVLDPPQGGETAVAAASPATPSPASPAAASPAEEGSTASPRWIWLVVGVGTAVMGTAVIWLWWRRRS